MILIYICGTIILIGLIMAIVGKIFKLKKIKLAGILIMIFLLIGFAIYWKESYNISTIYVAKEGVINEIYKKANIYINFSYTNYRNRCRINFWNTRI